MDFAMSLTRVAYLISVSILSVIAEFISVFMSGKSNSVFLFALPIQVSSRPYITAPAVCDRPDQSAVSLHFPQFTFYVSVIVG